jgi:hypothetical protein
MELLDFYRALLPGKGQYALFSVPRKVHVWADSLEKLVALTEKTSQEHSWYYATAAFTERQRKQEFVAAKRCLYLDIDAGPEKHARDPEGTYATQKEAAEAVFSFAKATGLVPSIVVGSGAGLHVYFAFEDDLDPDTWRGLAEGLEAIATSAGLRVDPACTTDSARILRPLGALHKNGNRVKVLAVTRSLWTPDRLRRIVGAREQTPVVPSAPRARLDVNAKLNLWEPVPASAVKAAEKCAALRRVADLKGDVPEPEWRAMIGVVKFSVEGADLAHEWSCGYADYSPEETQQKYDRYEGTGPTLCSTFERLNPAACAACPHRGKTNTPLTLGRLTDKQIEALPEDKRPAAESQQVPEELPIPTRNLGADFRITRGEHGGYVLEFRKSIVQDSDEGKTTLYRWTRLSNDVFWLEGWVAAGQSERDGAIVALKVWRDGHVVSFDLPTRNLATKQDAMKFLLEKGLSPSSTDAVTINTMHRYVMEQFNVAKHEKPRPAIRNHFGLQYLGEGDKAEFVCAHGPYVIYADGRIEQAILGRQLKAHRNMFTIASLPPQSDGRWSPSVWKDYIIPGAHKQAEFYRYFYKRSSYETAQLAIMLALASPLLVFVADDVIKPGANLPPVGLTVSLYSSETARGKSSMQKAAAAAYGNPAQTVLSGSNKDTTENYQSGLMAALGTMPFFADEVTGNDAAEVAHMVNRIASGSDRRRADRSGAPREANTWALVGTVSTNVPQRELLALHQKSSDALQMRLLELTCEFPELEEAQHTEYKAKVDELMVPNFGSLGALLHLAILQMGPEKVRAMMQKRYVEAVTHIRGATQRQRFLQRGMACALGAHDLLAALKIELFDRDVLLRQYERAAKDAVDFAATVSRTPIEMLRKMVSDLAPHIIVTENDELRSGGTGRFVPILNQKSLRAPYAGRRMQTAGRLFLLADAMKGWAKENQVSLTELINHAKRTGVLVEFSARGGYSQQVTITRGTSEPTVAGPAYCFDDRRLFGEDATSIPDNVVPLRVRDTRSEPNDSASQGDGELSQLA